MILQMPRYIDIAKIADEPVTYAWNNERPSEAYLGDDAKLMHQFAKISRRGKVSLAAGMAEWIAWRLSKQSEDEALFQVIEALWASTIDWRYIKTLKTHERKMLKKDWPGPVRGPICSTYSILATISFDAGRDMATEQWMVPLSNLAIYVIKDPKPFKAWRRSVTERLIQLHPRTTADPTGVPVPREALDPAVPYKPEMAPELVSGFLAKLDYRINPYLQTPEEMKNAGFDGTPYCGGEGA